jgi:hypothetical protein
VSVTDMDKMERRQKHTVRDAQSGAQRKQKREVGEEEESVVEERGARRWAFPSGQDTNARQALWFVTLVTLHCLRWNASVAAPR